MGDSKLQRRKKSMLWDMILQILEKAEADEAAKIAIEAIKEFFNGLKNA